MKLWPNGHQVLSYRSFVSIQFEVHDYGGVALSHPVSTILTHINNTHLKKKTVPIVKLRANRGLVAFYVA
jgi:hypothetical protein